MTCTKQLEANIAFCVDELDLDDNSIGEMLRCIERMGISSVEYFCEEFVFECFDNEGNEDLEALERVYDENYLPIQWRLD